MPIPHVPADLAFTLAGFSFIVIVLFGFWFARQYIKTRC